MVDGSVDVAGDPARRGHLKLAWTGLDWLGVPWTGLEYLGLAWTTLDYLGLALGLSSCKHGSKALYPFQGDGIVVPDFVFGAYI